jgi:microcystin-dependent protein
MSDPFIGEVRIFPYDFAPQKWAFCDGQAIPISQNTQLFAVIQTTFGGNGTTTFNLPHMSARCVIGAGQGPGLSSYDPGEQGGSYGVVLAATEAPAHTHTLKCASAFAGDATTNKPGPAESLAKMVGAGAGGYAITASTPSVMHPQVIGDSNVPTGVTHPIAHVNVMPYLALHYCIALQGVSPKRP